MKIQATLFALLTLTSGTYADTQLNAQDLFIETDAFPIASYDDVVLGVGENLHLDGTTDSIVGYHVHPPLMNGMGPDYVPELDYSAILRDNGSIDAQFDRDGKYMVQVVRASGDVESFSASVGFTASYNVCVGGVQKAFPCPNDTYQYVGNDVSGFPDGFNNRRVVNSLQGLVNAVTNDFNNNGQMPIDITIADHGCSGSFTINGVDKVSLNPADAANLALFCSLAGKVCSVTLIACSAAQGDAGLAFICQLSACLGDVQVKAWKTDITVSAGNLWTSADPIPVVKGTPWNFIQFPYDSSLFPEPLDLGLTLFDNRFATTDGLPLDPLVCPMPIGDQQIHQDLWFCFIPPVDGPYQLEILGPFQSAFALYPGCGGLPQLLPQPLLCDDPGLPLPTPGFTGLDLHLQALQPVMLRVGGALPGEVGIGGISILPAPLPPLFPELCNGDGGNGLGCTDCPCGNNAQPGSIGGCLNSAGTGARLVPSGLPEQQNDTLHFDMVQATPDSFAILISGDAIGPANPSNPCFGLGAGSTSFAFDGLRCAIGNVQRHGPRAIDGNGEVGASGPGWGPPNGPLQGLMQQGGFLPGQTRFFQAIYRESAGAGCGTGQNTSQAVEVVFQP